MCGLVHCMHRGHMDETSGPQGTWAGRPQGQQQPTVQQQPSGPTAARAAMSDTQHWPRKWLRKLLYEVLAATTTDNIATPRAVVTARPGKL